MERRLLKYTQHQHRREARLPFAPFAFISVYHNVDEIAEGVQGSVTATAGSFVTHMLYADDLTLMAEEIKYLRRQ
jgi:hypothetical protein